MDDVSHLESIAQQLIARVRDDDPASNQRWLHAVTTTEQREALLYVLAAAVPDTERWSDLTAWCSGGRAPGESQTDYRKRYQREWGRQRRRDVAA